MKNIDSRPRDTGLAAVLILLLVTWFTANATWALPAIVVLVLTMTLPVVFTPLAVIWFGLAELLGHVISNLILTILFFTVLMPIGVVRKIFGADALTLRKWKNKDGTVFISRDHLFSAGDLEKPY